MGAEFDEAGHFVGCQYRLFGDATNSVRCGIGASMPDDKYLPDFEGHGIHTLFESPVYGHLIHAMFSYDDRPWLDEFQSAHDDIARREDWTEAEKVESYVSYLESAYGEYLV